MGQVLNNRLEAQALFRLVSRGLAQIAALKPTDASNVLDYTDVWDKGTGAGVELGAVACYLAQKVVDQLTFQTTLVLLESAFAEEETDFGAPAPTLASHPLFLKGLSCHCGILKIDTGLNVPVVGLGASAPTYYPAIGQRLKCEMILPSHAEVANAIGAVAGRVTMRASGSITNPSEGLYRVHLGDGVLDFIEEQEALLTLERTLCQSAKSAARSAGADDVELYVSREIRKANVESREMFVEAEVHVVATGRPGVANMV